MLKKNIKSCTIACMIVCIFPSMTYGISTDDFLKYLINSSYPEVRSDEEKSNNESSIEKSDDKVDENKEQDDEYIKFHVGEENMPDIEPSNKEEKQVNSTSNSSYKNDIRVTKDNPTMMIYHTHGCETYSDNPDGNYHAKDYENSVLKSGEVITDELEKRGWGVVHSTVYNDLDYNKSYTNSLAHSKDLLSKYNEVDIVIDLHRDATTIKTDADKKRLNDKYTTTINGEEVSKFYFVVGPDNDNYENLKKIADEITALAEKKYPGITMPVLVKDYGRYNQYIAKNSMLIELGSNATTSKQSQATGKYLAEILDEYFKDYK